MHVKFKIARSNSFWGSKKLSSSGGDWKINWTLEAQKMGVSIKNYKAIADFNIIYETAHFMKMKSLPCTFIYWKYLKTIIYKDIFMLMLN